MFIPVLVVKVITASRTLTVSKKPVLLFDNEHPSAPRFAIASSWAPISSRFFDNVTIGNTTRGGDSTVLLDRINATDPDNLLG